jgi:glycosyltransferase involved in cell wall biosynthesis
VSTPSVSVVLATRDRVELLRRAIDGVLTQQHDAPIECVVVFDQSEPDASLARNDGNRSVRVLANTRAPGLAGARNTGLLAAQGDLVAFCDDDDEWLPRKLALQVADLRAAPASVLAATGIVVASNGRELTRVHAGRAVAFDELVRSRMMEAHPSTFLAWRDRVLNEIGLVDEGVPGSYGEDYDWLLRAAAVAPVVMTPQALVRVHWHGASFFNERWRTIDTALAYLQDKHPALRDDPAGSARILGQRAFARAAAGDRRGARRLAATSLRRNWRERRAYVALLASTGIVSASRVQRTLNALGRGV